MGSPPTSLLFIWEDEFLQACICGEICFPICVLLIKRKHTW